MQIIILAHVLIIVNDEKKNFYIYDTLAYTLHPNILPNKQLPVLEPTICAR